MQTIKFPINKLTVWPKKQCNWIQGTEVTLLISDHAYARMQQRLKSAYDNHSNKSVGENLVMFFHRYACETAIKIMNLGYDKEKDSRFRGFVMMVRFSMIWIYDWNRSIPALITVYPENRNWKQNKEMNDEIDKAC